MESRRMRGISPTGIMVEAGSVKTCPFLRRERGGHMPRYVVLVNWTDQGIRNVKPTAWRSALWATCEPPRSGRTMRKRCRGYSEDSAEPFILREGAFYEVK